MTLPEEKIPAVARELFASLRSDAVIANLYWKLLSETFTGTEKRGRLLAETAGHFFQYARLAFQDAVVLRIARMNDPARSGRNANVSLAALVERVAPLVPTELATGLDELLKRAREAADPAILRRHKVTVHRDAETVLAKEPAIPGVSRVQMEAALNAIASLLNAIQYHFMEESRTFYDGVASGSGGRAVVVHLERSLRAEDDERVAAGLNRIHASLYGGDDE